MTKRTHRVFRAAALVLVFMLGGLGALGTEWLRVRRAVRWTSTATIRFPAEWSRILSGIQRANTPITPQSVVAEVLAAAHPPGGPDRSGAGKEADRDSLTPPRRLAAERLRATVHQADERHLEVRLQYTAPSSDLAVEELNTLVCAYTARIQWAVAREVLDQMGGFRAADDRFKEEVAALRPELDRLVDRAVKLAAYRSEPGKPGEKRGNRPRMPSKETPPGKAEAPLASGARNEPQTTLEALRDRRNELLRDRTPAHPDVRYVDALITDAEKQLEEIPVPPPETTDRTHRQPPQPVVAASVASTPPNPRAAASSRDASQWGELFRALQSLQNRVETLSQAVQTTQSRQVSGSYSSFQGDVLTVHWAEQAEMNRPYVQPWALFWAATAAGLVLAAGTAMVYAGLRIDSPIGSGDEKETERILGLTVAGTITTLESVTIPERSGVTRWKWPCIVAGTVVNAVYFAFLLQPILVQH